MIKEQLINTVINNKHLTFLLIIILFDIFTGIIRAICERDVHSSVGIKGLLKHTLIIFSVIMTTLLSPIFEFEKINGGILIFYMIEYGFSIIENFVAIGLPVPRFLFQILKDKSKDYKGVGEDEV